MKLFAPNPVVPPPAFYMFARCMFPSPYSPPPGFLHLNPNLHICKYRTAPIKNQLYMHDTTRGGETMKTMETSMKPMDKSIRTIKKSTNTIEKIDKQHGQIDSHHGNTNEHQRQFDEIHGIHINNHCENHGEMDDHHGELMTKSGTINAHHKRHWCTLCNKSMNTSKIDEIDENPRRKKQRQPLKNEGPQPPDQKKMIPLYSAPYPKQPGTTRSINSLQWFNTYSSWLCHLIV